MLSPPPRQSRARDLREQSPFSSPYSNIQSSPIAARRTSLEERRRPAAKFESALSPGPTDRVYEEDIEEEDEEGEGDNDVEEEQDVDEDEDGEDAGELSPLLPIFSAAHLGMWLAFSIVLSGANDDVLRFSSRLQSHTYRSTSDCSSVRNNSFLGPVALPSGLAIPCQADSTADQSISFLQSYALRSDGELLAVQQRGTNQSGEQRS